MPWTSKTVPGAAPKPILNPPVLIVRLASNRAVSTNSSKSRELEEGLALLIESAVQVNWPADQFR